MAGLQPLFRDECEKNNRAVDQIENEYQKGIFVSEGMELFWCFLIRSRKKRWTANGYKKDIG